jgi:hypothetical protein
MHVWVLSTTQLAAIRLATSIAPENFGSPRPNRSVTRSLGIWGIIVIEAIIEIVYMDIPWPPTATLGVRCRLKKGIDDER